MSISRQVPCVADPGCLSRIQVHQRAPPHGCLSQDKCPMLRIRDVYPGSRFTSGPRPMDVYLKASTMYTVLFSYIQWCWSGMFILDPGSPAGPAPWMSISRQVPCILFFLLTSGVTDPGCLSRTPISQTTTKKKRGRRKISSQKFHKIVKKNYFWAGTGKIWANAQKKRI